MTIKLYIQLAVLFFVIYGIIFLFLKYRSKNEFSYTVTVYLPVYSCSVMLASQDDNIFDVFSWIKDEEKYALRFDVRGVFGSTQLVFLDRNVKFKVSNIKWIPEDGERVNEDETVECAASYYRTHSDIYWRDSVSGIFVCDTHKGSLEARNPGKYLWEKLD